MKKVTTNLPAYFRGERPWRFSCGGHPEGGDEPGFVTTVHEYLGVMVVIVYNGRGRIKGIHSNGGD